MHYRFLLIAALVIVVSHTVGKAQALATVHIYRLANPHPAFLKSFSFFVDGVEEKTKLDPMSMVSLKLTPGAHTFGFSKADSLGLSINLESGKTYFLRSKRITTPYFQHVKKATAQMDLSTINAFVAEMVSDDLEETCITETTTRDEFVGMPPDLTFTYDRKVIGNLGYRIYTSGIYEIVYSEGMMMSDKKMEAKLYLGDELFRLVWPSLRGDQSRSLELLDNANRLILTRPGAGEKRGFFTYPDGTSFYGETKDAETHYFGMNYKNVLIVNVPASLGRAFRLSWVGPTRNREMFLAGLDLGSGLIRAREQRDVATGLKVTRFLLFGF